MLENSFLVFYGFLTTEIVFTIKHRGVVMEAEIPCYRSLVFVPMHMMQVHPVINKKQNFPSSLRMTSKKSDCKYENIYFFGTFEA